MNRMNDEVFVCDSSIYCFEAIQEISGIRMLWDQLKITCPSLPEGTRVIRISRQSLWSGTSERIRSEIKRMKVWGWVKVWNVWRRARLRNACSSKQRRCFWVECSLRQVPCQVLPALHLHKLSDFNNLKAWRQCDKKCSKKSIGNWEERLSRLKPAQVPGQLLPALDQLSELWTPGMPIWPIYTK